MPGPQFVGGPPKGMEPTRVLVIGPEDCEARKLVYDTLYEVTLRLEYVEVLLPGEMKNKNMFKVPPVGVTQFAGEWAELEWWTRRISNPLWHGRGPTGIRKWQESILSLIGRKGRCVFFYDGETNYLTDLAELARDQIRPKHFTVRRC